MITTGDIQLLQNVKQNGASTLTHKGLEQLEKIYHHWTNTTKPLDLYCNTCVEELVRRLTEEALPELLVGKFKV